MIDLRAGLSLPLIVAPMSGVSTPELAAAACGAGVIGSFPTHNARSLAQLDEWLAAVTEQAAAVASTNEREPSPLAVNVVLKRPAAVVEAEIALLAERQVRVVIASVGSPAPIVDPLHSAAAMVLADVGSMRHVRRAMEAGVDGLVLLSAGAGGQTGWLNGMAFVRAVRAEYSGPIVLAGGVSDGAALWAAEVLGCDLAYMGTRFIVADESAADTAYRDALLDASMDDIVLTTQGTGIAANFLHDRFPGVVPGGGRHGYSAGHTVSGITSGAGTSTAAIVARTAAEYAAAREATAALLRSGPSQLHNGAGRSTNS